MNSISRYWPNWLLTLLAVLMFPAIASAHPGGDTSGWLSGVAHPFSGLDHLCVMFGVGLWAAQRGGRAIWLLPLAFISIMVVGGALGMAAVSLPYVEQGIVVSVLIVGFIIATAARLPLAVSMLLVGLFALLHGHAHGLEMPATASGVAYGVGFVVATALLHLAGVGLGIVARQPHTARAVRFTGIAIMLCGFLLLRTL